MKKSVALGLALCLLFRSAGCGRAASGTAGAAAPPPLIRSPRINGG